MCVFNLRNHAESKNHRVAQAKRSRHSRRMTMRGLPVCGSWCDRTSCTLCWAPCQGLQPRCVWLRTGWLWPNLQVATASSDSLSNQLDLDSSFELDHVFACRIGTDDMHGGNGVVLWRHPLNIIFPCPTLLMAPSSMPDVFISCIRYRPITLHSIITGGRIASVVAVDHIFRRDCEIIQMSGSLSCLCVG